MAAASSSFKSAPVLNKMEWIKVQQPLRHAPVSFIRCRPTTGHSFFTVRASAAATSYPDELVKTAKTVASPGRGILAMDESNATCRKRLASIGLQNTEANRQAYRTLLVTAPGLGQYVSGAILFEETLYNQQLTENRLLTCWLSRTLFRVSRLTRVWCPCLARTMSRGAKVSMALLPAQLLTISRAHDLLNGVLL